MHAGFWWENFKEESLGRPRRRWKYNNKIGLKGIGCEGVD